MNAFALACPECHAPLAPDGAETLICARDGLRFRRENGIWRMLLPGRADYFARFLGEYETIRRAEGRISDDPAYYRALPYRDLGGRMRAAWRIRAASFDTFLRRVLQPAAAGGRPLNILDLGAGCGWFSYRMALRGHTAMALDLAVNDFDGLGCEPLYDARFTPVQAEFEHLPVPDGSIDLAVFNSSLHYSEDLPRTIAEALRVLLPGGRLVILDSPVYQHAASGEQMLREREALFQKQYGFPSNALAMRGYLTYAQIAGLAREFHLEYRVETPFFGPGWSLAPLLASLRGRREPARFHVHVFTRAVTRRRAFFAWESVD